MKQAVEADNAGEYARALELYKQGLEWFTTHLKFEKNPHSKKAITDKARQRRGQRRRPAWPFLGSCRLWVAGKWVALRC